MKQVPRDCTKHQALVLQWQEKEGDSRQILHLFFTTLQQVQITNSYTQRDISQQNPNSGNYLGYLNTSLSYLKTKKGNVNQHSRVYFLKMQKFTLSP